MTKILYSKPLYEEKLKNLKKYSTANSKLAILRLEKNFGNSAYLKGLTSTANKVDLEVVVIDTTPENAYSDLQKLNEDDSVTGILIFRPIPDGVDEDELDRLISPEKDVDCMNPINKAKLYSGDTSGFIPLAPKASIELLDYYGIDVESKNCLIINHSNVVGKPLAMLLLNRFATVEIAHIKTKNLREHSLRADIIFTAVGESEFLDSSYFSEDAIVIDIAITRNEDGRFTGDLNSADIQDKIKAYSPVPNGVGGLTNLLLIESVIK
ncbi:methylenetetrahydrofolate dehydrogenase (NADP+) / methenyltetrahydrofolate cyclohydrolase [Peptoniphilus asaccharolyticus DSM 20463]|uniref:Methylenetetrahydrofolate dehydrogenase (NADP+) / methenyltetrahydrofolate cyclohydrolase n=1 Tax=Peptoniphilus asaccharolyticus DSM 20463 TaxID=573058 RepID=A0A1W1UKE9_PEPAS|nr:bifunctional 5,10-methylenetetrahydrofolate dehydrogenase/5,10-methenyltetrahydrofolate cyclohydrolase [Peptoniphilus asaccharolyticus]MBL7574850.1 bifunctional 5,10-methylenetetrahydrofolate dehydrogenase/5,10-methenyltetrahydrofolate cyclohydrolase [Peptoniphilus asaccharolyticus]SMB81598.1 methylenetetrahydrofolate dehydrogenase (NADP+) / methenyltetrahydrofolate cyclohydrolase [Peptoniphilus asaccharolyticus DSM 20463]